VKRGIMFRRNDPGNADPIQPWETLTSRVVFQDSFKHLEVQKCRLPNGTILSNYYVDRYHDWVNVVALTPDRKFIFVRQYRHALGEITIETAAGTLDPGEDNPDEAAKRELLEETGFHPGTMHKLGELAPNPALQDNLVHIYLAENCVNSGKQKLDPHEIIDVVLMTAAEVREGIIKGTFKHALGLVAILLYFQSLEK